MVLRSTAWPGLLRHSPRRDRRIDLAHERGGLSAHSGARARSARPAIWRLWRIMSLPLLGVGRSATRAKWISGGGGAGAAAGLTAARAGGEGRPGAAQRHAGFDRATRCAACSRRTICSRAVHWSARCRSMRYWAAMRRSIRASTRCAVDRAGRSRRAVAADLMAGSAISRHRTVNCDRVQDPYSLRCQPQVHGRVPDMLRQAAEDADRRSQRRHRQPFGLCRPGRRYLRRQLPRRAGGYGRGHAWPLAIAEIGATLRAAHRRC